MIIEIIISAFFFSKLVRTSRKNYFRYLNKASKNLLDFRPKIQNGNPIKFDVDLMQIVLSMLDYG